MTRRIYYLAPDQLEFTSRVVRSKTTGTTTLVELEQTAFYVEGGGQPSDTGTLNGHRVLRVYEAGGVVWHEVDVGEFSYAKVEGRVDADRRYDFSEQHTGQHVLSQAFWTLYGAVTSSFHLTSERVSIDLSKGDLTAEEIAEAERLSNEVIRSGRVVRAHIYKNREDLPAELRKMPVVEGPIRIIEVEGFDRCPCGGTHLANTYRLGLVKVLGFERARGRTRVDFLCGNRALKEFERRLESDNKVSQLISLPYEHHARAVERLLEAEKNLTRTVNLLNKEIMEFRVREAEPAQRLNGFAYYKYPVWEGEFEDAKLFSALLIKKEPAVAVAVLPGETTRLVLASSVAQLNAGSILKEAVTANGGKGGGTPMAAQGGVPADRLQVTLASLERAIGVGTGSR